MLTFKKMKKASVFLQWLQKVFPFFRIINFTSHDKKSFVRLR